MPEIILKQPCIYEYPQQIHTPVPASTITLGDAHGNTCKILHLLIQQGILLMDESAYKQFMWIYPKHLNWQHSYPPNDNELTPVDLDLLRRIIAGIQLNPMAEKVKIRLIGDELSDRGSNDYFTILLLKHLIDLGADMEFMMSNHGAEFLYYYFFKQHSPTFRRAFNNSQVALIQLIEKGWVDESEIEQFMTDYYLPRLIPLSYSVDQNIAEMTHYSHAPVSLAFIKRIASFLQIQYNDTTIFALLHTIDQINVAVKQQLKDVIGKIRTVLSDDYPLDLFIENRTLHAYDHDYPIEAVFGHIGPNLMVEDPQSVLEEKRVFNLDSYCGHPQAEQHCSSNSSTFDVKIHHSQQPSFALTNLQIRQTLAMDSLDKKSLNQAAEQWSVMLSRQAFILTAIPHGLALGQQIQSLLRQVPQASASLTVTYSRQLRSLIDSFAAYQAIAFPVCPTTRQRLIALLNTVQQTMQSLNNTEAQLAYLTTRLPTIVRYAQLTSLMMTMLPAGLHNIAQLLFTALQDLLQQTWLLPDGQSSDPCALLTVSQVLTQPLHHMSLQEAKESKEPAENTRIPTLISSLIPPKLVARSKCQAFISAVTSRPNNPSPAISHAQRIIAQAKSVYGQLPNSLYREILEQTMTLTDSQTSPRKLPPYQSLLQLQTYQSLIQQVDCDRATQRFKKGIFIFMGSFAVTVGVLMALSFTGIATLPVGGILALTFLISVSATAIAQKWLPRFPDRSALANNMRSLYQNIQDTDETQSSANPLPKIDEKIQDEKIPDESYSSVFNPGSCP